MPDSRWVSGEDSRRLVHLMRAASDAVAVGMGTVRWENPRLDARGVPVVRQPRRLAFGKGPLPEDSELELRSGALREELELLAEEAFSRSCSKAAPRSRPRSSSTTSSTRCSSSSHRSWPVRIRDARGAPAPVALTRFESRPMGTTS